LRSSKKSAPVLRVGSVPYLNARALVYGLEQHAACRLEFHPPSRLARRLASGRLDVALVSSIESLRRPGYRIVPGLSISARKEMWSILLFHRVPLERMRRVALDPDSETTNALLRVVLKEGHGLAPRYVKLTAGEDPARRKDLDGWLRIGDPALTARAPGCRKLDLAQAWWALTGKPFVFALWLVRDGVDLRGLDQWLREARDEGLRHAREIARAEGPRLSMSTARAQRYITQVVRYGFGAEEMAGLKRFQEGLWRLGLLKRRCVPRLYGSGRVPQAFQCWASR
jgi:chorismate dehydratase